MINDIKFSVLMSLYIKEKTEYARECFDSLAAQTVKASEWVIVEDGPLTPEMYNLLDEYEKKYPGLIKRVPFEVNRGLGIALNEGIKRCSNEIVARMDTDDVAMPDRFELQLQEFINDPDLDICGSNIAEFETIPDEIVSYRMVPLHDAEIKKYQKRRDAFNHMTVMYKKSAVLAAGNYQSCLLMEDTLLWAKMIMNGAKCKNRPEYLVHARIGHDMFERRGGYDYFKKYKQGRKKVKATGFIGWYDHFITLTVQFIVAVMPSGIRGFIYKKLLHK